MMNLIKRPRRNRAHGSMRSLLCENKVTVDDLILPLFLLGDESAKSEIKSMPGQFRFGRKELISELKESISLGIKMVCLFPILPEEKKDSMASIALKKEMFYYQRIKEIKDLFPELVIMTDVALDPYSSDGHDGIVDPKTKTILNDQTIEVLTKMSILQAQAGADYIGPSDMMDGRVGAIRKGLDSEGFTNTAIFSYAAKYASSFYGPFRDALDSAPKFGDKKTYQMNPANRREALLEAKLDEAEGADVLMVKPGLAYLDIISDLRRHSNLPIAAYNVSGEYAMVKAAGERGWCDETAVMNEMLVAFKRAGADLILSYFAKDFAAQRIK